MMIVLLKNKALLSSSYSVFNPDNFFEIPNTFGLDLKKASIFTGLL